MRTIPLDCGKAAGRPAGGGEPEKLTRKLMVQDHGGRAEAREDDETSNGWAAVGPGESGEKGNSEVGEDRAFRDDCCDDKRRDDRGTKPSLLFSSLRVASPRVHSQLYLLICRIVCGVSPHVSGGLHGVHLRNRALYDGGALLSAPQCAKLW